MDQQLEKDSRDKYRTITGNEEEDGNPNADLELDVGRKRIVHSFIMPMKKDTFKTIRATDRDQ